MFFLLITVNFRLSFPCGVIANKQSAFCIISCIYVNLVKKLSFFYQSRHMVNEHTFFSLFFKSCRVSHFLTLTLSFFTMRRAPSTQKNIKCADKLPPNLFPVSMSRSFCVICWKQKKIHCLSCSLVHNIVTVYFLFLKENILVNLVYFKKLCILL